MREGGVGTKSLDIHYADAGEGGAASDFESIRRGRIRADVNGEYRAVAFKLQTRFVAETGKRADKAFYADGLSVVARHEDVAISRSGDKVVGGNRRGGFCCAVCV